MEEKPWALYHLFSQLGSAYTGTFLDYTIWLFVTQRDILPILSDFHICIDKSLVATYTLVLTREMTNI